MMQRMIIAAVMVVTSATFAGIPECPPQQVAKLTADDGAYDDRFGISVALDAGVAVIGAWQDDDNDTESGSAYVYEQQADGTWQQIAKLTADDGAEGDYFGNSVALDAGVAVIGAYRDNDDGSDSGSAYVFEQQGDGTWQQTAKLTADDGAINNFFGRSVATSGGVAVIGADQDDDNGQRSGSAYVYEQQADGTWQQIAKLTADDGASDDQFGNSVALDAGVAVIGARYDGDNSTDSGSAYVYQQQADGTWQQTAKLTADDWAEYDYFGRSVSIDTGVAVIGADGDDDNGSRSGSAYVYEQQADGTWQQIAKLTADDGASYDFFGWSVALDAGVAVIGAYGDDDNGYQSGSAYVYEQQEDGTWQQTAKLTPDYAASVDLFGYSVATSGGVAVIGAYRDDDAGSDSGSAYVFELQNTGTDTDGDGTADCNDGCPIDPLKVDPGQCGCGVADTDTDGDGTADCNDGCPNDPLKVDPEQCGCGVADTDTDGDGTADCNDGCPNDPSKVDPGQCGCGVADTDTDGDGTADCNDGCPNDPNKIDSGICGCGVADTDTDGDGTADCNDGCPNDPNKIDSGICGCGVADTDSDGDGTPDCNDAFPNDPNESEDLDGDGIGNNSDPCPAWVGECTNDGSAWTVTPSDGEWAIQDAMNAALDAYLYGMPLPSSLQLAPGQYLGFDIGHPIEVVGAVNGDGSPAVTINGQIGIYDMGPNIPGGILPTLRNVVVSNPGSGSAINIYGPMSPLITGCVIEGNTGTSWSTGGGITCFSGSTTTIIDCIIRNNNAYSYGGAIALYGSTASISNCTMSNNSAPNRGGAVYAENSSIIMTDCDISSNQASDGGGIWLSNSEVVVQSCDVEGNNADDDGGGIYASGSGNTLTVYDSAIVTNFAANEAGGSDADDGGGGIYIIGGELELIQSSVSSNSTNGNAGGLLIKNASVRVLHSTVQANASPYFVGGIYSQGSMEIASSKVCGNSLSQIFGAYVDAGGNSIAVDCDSQIGACCVESPDLGELCLFADSPGCATYGGQWHGAGTSCTTNSPCAIELPACPADVTGDWRVNVIDIIFLLDAWGSSSSEEDANDDGLVNIADLLLVLENWGDCEVLQ